MLNKIYCLLYFVKILGQGLEVGRGEEITRPPKLLLFNFDFPHILDIGHKISYHVWLYIHYM